MKKLFNEAACIVEDSLVVADLHLGVEMELLSSGLVVPSMKESMQKRLLELIKRTGVDRLVILGDLKHSIVKTTWKEHKEVSGLVAALKEEVDVVLVKGNHDSAIETLLPGVEVVDHLVLGETLLVHGHRRAPGMGFKRILTAHNHPAVEFVDPLGARLREKVWLELVLREEAVQRFCLDISPRITVMPAFNELIEGRAFNLEPGGQGPLLREELVDVGEAEVFLLDGTELGRLRDLAELCSGLPPGRREEQ